MALHEKFTELSGIPVYFADPRSPWQRGTNENTNGLIREFFPKGSPLNLLSINEIQIIENLITNRPREVLGYNSPHESVMKSLYQGLKIA